MAEKCIDNFIDFAHKQLSLIENKDGEVIYSSKDTLKKGKYYFLGLNPGGEGFISIKNHLNNFSLKTDNSFFKSKSVLFFGEIMLNQFSIFEIFLVK